MSSSKLGDISFLSLLPASIRDDGQLAAAAAGLDSLLGRTTAAIPNLLLWARLDRERRFYPPPLTRLIGNAGGLKALSPELLELLAWQLHVDFREAAATPAQLEGMVKNSITWHRIKGTPGGIKDALTLFGLQAVIEEDGAGDYWATYQIGLPSIADLETVKLVSRVAYAMHPARCSLYRIYTDVWDVRPGVYDVGFYDDAAYDYYSGVDVPGLPDGGDLIVSFGRLLSAQSRRQARRLSTGRARLRGVTPVPDDGLSYDVARYDETLTPANHGFSRFHSRSRVYGRPAHPCWGWTGAWDGRPWNKLLGVNYDREPFSFNRRCLAIVEGLYDDSAYDGGFSDTAPKGQDAFYEQSVFTLVDAVPAYDAAAYDRHAPARKTVVVDEMRERVRRGRTEPLLAPEARAGVRPARFGEHQAWTEPLLARPAAWRDSCGWDGRVWRIGGAFGHIYHGADEGGTA